MILKQSKNKNLYLYFAQMCLVSTQRNFLILLRINFLYLFFTFFNHVYCCAGNRSFLYIVHFAFSFIFSAGRCTLLF